MKCESTHYRMFHIFGLRIYITREPLKPRHRSDKRQIAYRQRMELAGHVCECCGAPLTKFGHKLHTLPKGHPDRNSIDELRVICSECFNRIQSRVYHQCYDATAPAYTDIVNKALADVCEDKKGGEA